MKEKVTHIGEASGNSDYYTPLQTLQAVISDIEEGHISPNKILVISLDNRDGKYNTNFHQAKMTMSECIALCEVMKVRFLQGMYYIPYE